jgi:hypothetical protein
MSDGQINAYVELKMEEVIRSEQTPHPVESDMDYSVQDCQTHFPKGRCENADPFFVVRLTDIGSMRSVAPELKLRRSGTLLWTRRSHTRKP